MQLKSRQGHEIEMANDSVRLRLRRPDDWHLHLRDGPVMASVLPHSAKRFARAIVMPNLQPPVTSVEAARAYRGRIMNALPPEADFSPLMTLYLTDRTSPAEIEAAVASDAVFAVKLYPAGATTHSAHGVTDLRNVMPALEAMEAAGLPLLVHGEVVDPAVDIFDREHVFIERVLTPLLERLPRLKVVLEHITTQAAVAFVQAGEDRLGATITPHHLVYNRNALLAGGIRPHHYCLPVLKRETHRQALITAATSGSPRFFLGTDSAPHPRRAKETGCGCAGVFNAHAAIELYAEVFAQAGALDRLEGFASVHGARFYGLPINDATLMMQRRPWPVPDEYPLADDSLIPLRAGQALEWRIVDDASAAGFA